MLLHQRGRADCRCAFCSLNAWDGFDTAIRARPDLANTNAWLDRNSELVRWQLAHKFGMRTRVSTGGLENVLERVASAPSTCVAA
jgi:hypothetical protein